MQIQEGNILKGSFWPEKVRVISAKIIGESQIKFDVIGEVLVGKSLKDLIVDAIANRRTMEEILEDFERIPDEEAIRRVRETSLEALATRHIDLTRILGEQRRAIENRLVPEYVEEFFKRAAAMLKIRMEERGDGLWRIVSVPFEIRNQPYEFKIKFGEVQREYAKISFDKESAFKAQAEFVAMGHPLLEAVINSILTIYAQSAADGATFIDPEGRKGGIIWFLEIGEGLENYKKELLERRQRDADIKQKYGIRSLESMILDSDGKISEYETRRMKGENIPEATIQNEVRKKEDLERKKQRLQREIEAEVHLYPTDPGILGAVRVVPGKPHGDMVSDMEIEEIGMDIAMEYESGHGRTPENVSTQNLGYDIRSQDDTENYRYIEVKARAKEGAVALTPNEWLMAHRLKDEYWLYVVVNAASNPELYVIQNPALHFKPEEAMSIVRYIVKDWKEKARREK